MGHPKLIHSPLIETVCEFRFSPESKWDWTVPGRLAKEVNDLYPNSREIAPNVVVFGNDPEFSPNPERIQLISSDGLSMVQTGPKLLSVNRLAPYESWDAFQAQIMAAMEAHIRVCGWQPLNRIGLLYLNRLPKGADPAGPLQIGPRTEHMPKGIQMNGYFQEWYLEFDHSGLTLRVKGDEVAEPGVILQLDAFTSDPFWLASQSTIRDWIEQAHETIYKVFRSALTPEAFHDLEKG